MLSVSLLGEQVITDDGTGVRIRSSRVVALVAFLAVHAGSPQPRQRIAGLFWPDSAGAQALTNLRRELHQLRQLLGAEPSLVVTSKDLCWRDTETCRVDLRVFGIEREAALAAEADADGEKALVHAVRALAQYRGDLLPGMYDDWLLEARSELERQCADLCDLVSRTRVLQGDLAGAAEAVRRRIQLQPLEEVGYRTLMRLQTELGDRAGAVSTYHHCASVLERELGITPDPETQREFQRLMAGAGPQRRLVTRPEARRSGPAAVRLIGRVAELGQLHEMWRNAAAGRPGVVLVRGGAGVGKTRLVGEVAELARRQGAVVAGSQCFGTSGRLALAPVADWLRHPAVQSATATLQEAWRAEVGRLVPSGGRARRTASSRAMADAWQRHRFFEGLARALLAVGRPTLLMLDNAQWCDQETLAFLTFCLGLAPGAQLLIAGTIRDDSPAEAPVVRAWTDAMRATGLLTDVPLAPFGPADTARLAEAVCGRALPGTDASMLQATTGGFPLYVIEAMRGSDDRASAGDRASTMDPASTNRAVGRLTSVLRHRLEQASAAAIEVAGLAAAVGTDFTLDLLTEASDLDADLVVTAVDELWRRRIVREFGPGYDFAHDLLRETAYAQVSPPRRWLLHRRVAQGLELLHAEDTDMVAAQLAEQYARGGRPVRAAAYYRRAADVAAGIFAHSEAIRLHQEALSIILAMPAGRDRDRQELAVLEAMAAPLNARDGYSSPDLQQALERSVALAESLGQKNSTLTGLVALSTSRFVQGRIRNGHQLATRALALAQDSSDLSSPAHFVVGANAVSLGMPAAALRHLGLAVKLASGALSLSVGTRPDVHAIAFAAHAHWLLGQDDAARSSRDEAIELARSTGHPYNLAVALAYAAITDQLRHDMAALQDSVGELRELCDQYDFAYYREWGLILGGWSRTDEPDIRRGIDNLKSAGSFARLPYWLSLLADLLSRNDRPDAARATLDAALVSGQAHDDLWWLPEVLRMRSRYDEERDAISRLRSAARMASAHGSVALVLRCEHDLSQRGVRRPSPGGNTS